MRRITALIVVAAAVVAAGCGSSAAANSGPSTQPTRIRLALNWALFRVWEQGRFTDLWLRYFPISPF